ncbi:cell wall-associated NlpC family hydrolase [Ureibacillus acetophenoni]|uniref:Cell wall-associated NlpC family hydrolase n=2 Tax=Ureibacillus acetophenoni TaxID=614649 RepID=A0A285U330_9BACL|nr:cell wall-associated NlpC family hydrolase [Ureibacillus acetophenoni]
MQKKKWLIPVFASFMLFSGIGAMNAEAASVEELTSTAKQYLKAPYRYGGTSITSGIDCSAYTQYIFSKFGISLPRSSSEQFNVGTSVAKSDLQAGDLVFFNTNGRSISHVGIYIGDGKFISATTDGGVAIDSINDPYYWGSKYVGAKRVADFTAEEVEEAKAEVAKAEVKSVSVDFSIYTSRGEVALILAETLGLDTSDTNSPFVDVKPSDKYAGAVNALYKKGIFIGDEQKKFNPGSPMTRGELSLVLVNAFGLTQSGEAVEFKDVPTTHWAHDFVSILASNDITQGIGDGKYGIDDLVSKEQLSEFIEKLTEN